MDTTHTCVNGQGQRSLGSKVRVETDGRTDRQTEAIALYPVQCYRPIHSPSCWDVFMGRRPSGAESAFVI